jgi:hypothetical protein
VTHVSEQDLALYSGGDLGRLHGWRVRRHINGCAECRRELARFESAAGVLSDEGARLPAGMNWPAAAAEMAANIRLALDAGRIVDEPVRRRPELIWRPATLFASATALAVTAFWLNMPPQKVTPISTVSAVNTVSTAEDGIELKGSRGSLTLLRTKNATPALYISSPGTLRERFVDDDTGQVTINNVYVE